MEEQDVSGGTAAKDAPRGCVPGALPCPALSQFIGYYLSMAGLVVYRDFKAALGGLELTQQQYAVLEIIGANPGAAQVDIARTLDMDRATMMLLVDRLQDRGLVRRRINSADRRRVELHLEPAGEALKAQARVLVSAHERRLFAAWSEDELDVLRRLLARIGNTEPA